MPQANAIRIVTEPEREMRDRLAGIMADVHKRADRVGHARRDRDSRRDRIERLNAQHIEFVDPNMRVVTAWWLVIAAGLSIWAMDILQSASTSEYFGTRFAGLGPRGVAMLIILLPTAVFLFEVMVSSARHAMRPGPLGGRPAGYYGSLVLSLVPVLVMPAFIAATQLAVLAVSEGDSSSTAGLANAIRVAGVVTLAVALHAAVAFAPKLAHDGVAYAAYRVQVIFHERRRQAADDSQLRARSEMERLFGAYDRERKTWNQAHSDANIPQELPEQAALDILRGKDATAVGAAGDAGSATPPTPATPRRGPEREPQPRGPERGAAGPDPGWTADATGADARVRTAEAEVVA